MCPLSFSKNSTRCLPPAPGSSMVHLWVITPGMVTGHCTSSFAKGVMTKSSFIEGSCPWSKKIGIGIPSGCTAQLNLAQHLGALALHGQARHIPSSLAPVRRNRPLWKMSCRRALETKKWACRQGRWCGTHSGKLTQMCQVLSLGCLIFAHCRWLLPHSLPQNNPHSVTYMKVTF